MTIPTPTTVSSSTRGDVNDAFARERTAQAHAAAAAQDTFDARITAGILMPIGQNRFRVNDPASWDNGEILLRQDGRIVAQHGLDETRGTVALYSAVPPWHGLGTVIPGGTSDIDTVLALGGIDFDVTRRPVLYRLTPTDPATPSAATVPTSTDPTTTDPTTTDPSVTDSATVNAPPRELREHYVTVRSDTGDGLGVVGSRYTVLPNRTAFEFLNDLVDRHDVVWESAGALRGGRRVFVSMRLPDTVTIDAGGISDDIIPFLVAVNSHDGSSPFQVVITPWRPVCANTERFALRDAHARWSVRHTRNATDRITEARRTLGLSVRYFERFAAEEEHLARTPLTLTQFHTVVAQLWTPPEADAPTRAVTNHTRRLDQLTQLYRTTTDRLGPTAYTAERAITEYLDWHRPVRTGAGRDTTLTRATAVLEGTDDDLKSTAHRLLYGLAA